MFIDKCPLLGLRKGMGFRFIYCVALSVVLGSLSPLLARGQWVDEPAAPSRNIFEERGQYTCIINNQFGYPTDDAIIFYHDHVFVQANWFNNSSLVGHYLGDVFTAASDPFAKKVQDFTNRKTFGFKFTSTNSGGSTAIARAILFLNDPPQEMTGELLATAFVVGGNNSIGQEEVVYTKEIECAKSHVFTF